MEIIRNSNKNEKKFKEINEEFAVKILNFIKTIVEYDETINLNKDFKELHENISIINSKLNRQSKLLQDSINIEKQLKESIESLDLENQQKRINLLERLGITEED